MADITASGTEHLVGESETARQRLRSLLERECVAQVGVGVGWFGVLVTDRMCFGR